MAESKMAESKMADSKMAESKMATLKEQETIKKMKPQSPQQQPPKPINNEKELINLITTYLSNVTKEGDNEQLELEVKFGTLGGNKKITKINYDNILKQLLSRGFVIDSNEYLLRIQSEYRDAKTNKTQMSNIRTEINGLHNIQKYCKTNRIDTIDSGLSFIQKSRFNDKGRVAERGSSDMSSVDVREFNYRVSLSKEYSLNKESPLIRTMIDKWKDTKKTFRYLNRFKLRHPKFPVIVDMSIVKESKKKDNRYYIPEYNIHDSGVFTLSEKYEIEIEMINNNVGIGSAYNKPEILHKEVIKPIVKYVLSGLQETNYPISYSEQQFVIQEYMKLLWGKDYNETTRITSSNFVGPSSYTLELRNISPLDAASSVPNIRQHYTVTDKADGERKLLFIAPSGKIYLISTNMDVQFTGTLSKNKECWNTLFDGEHILYNKHKKFINMYAAFDIYYINGKDIRSNGFIPTKSDEIANNYRLPLLESVVNKINAVSIVKESAPVPLNITKKRFYLGSDTQSIFQGCTYILTKEHDGLFEYETDGLIFTPASFGVASNTVGEYVKPVKMTWEHSFKWKPSQFNTIDFLVSVKKNDDGTDFIGSLFSDGMNVTTNNQIKEYKTVILRVGFDESKHGFVNPYQDMIDDKLPNVKSRDDNSDKYVPMQFYPTEPSDYKAGICNIGLLNNADNDNYMYTENNEIIEDNMIVEFRYDMKMDKEWRWVPLRVRYDKTAQLRNGEKNYGNAFHVANSNWHSIHYPVTQLMLMTGTNIPEELSDDDVYYNKVTGVTKTRALRDFHNLYVKSALIKSISKPGDTMIDLAVGKGGDWPKWINAKLKFVFGVDISRDNIQNRMDGACARYLNYKKRYTVMPSALFVNGNSSVNIRKTTGILVDKDKQITRAVFGQGPKDAKILGQGVYKNYGIATDGFDICSIQFAIHYMFENQETLQNFLQNVAEVTKEGGYFIGTSYDGELLFNMLKTTKENDSKVIMVNVNDESNKDNKTKKTWEVIKRYDHDEFNDDETCVGYAVDVFQESINKTIREYLVNYTYLTRVLENYGFIPVTSEELEKNKSIFTSGTGLFNDLFNKMNNDIKKSPQMKSSYGDAPYMTDEERTISFLNRYFIYKKVRKVSDAEKVSLNLQHKYVNDEKYDKEETEEAQKDVRVVLKKPKTTRKETTKKNDKTTTNAAPAQAQAPTAAEAAPAPAPSEAPVAVETTTIVKKPITKLPKKIKLKNSLPTGMN
jgi:SAM-dependent methyltransferase